MSTLKGQRVLVMGLGLFGGGVGAVRFLLQEGAHVTVTDLRSADALRESLEALSGYPMRLKLGGHDEEDFRNSDLIVANPGVPRISPFLEVAERARVPVTTEICLLVERCPASVIGVTGTSGKTTTASLIGAMISRQDRRVLVGGNVGGSLLDRVDEMTPDTPVVLELSSFQLDRLGDMGWSPKIAVITNFAPNHLDVHGSLEAYREAKRKILVHQKSDDHYVVNADDPAVRDWGTSSPGRGIPFSMKKRLTRGVYAIDGEIKHTIRDSTRTVCRVNALELPGRHNVANALAAVGAAVCWGVREKDISASIRRFRGVAHRLERVAELRGVTYFNDSIATTPERAQVAVEAAPGPVILIAGGYDKGLRFDRFGPVVARKVSDLILIGQTADAIAKSIPKGAPTRLHSAGSLEDAVAAAADMAPTGSTVLFSPASASFDMFRNFEERGDTFRRLILSMEGAGLQEGLPT